MEITWKVTFIGDITMVWEKQVQVRDFVISTDDQFPTTICFNQFWDQKVSLIDSLKLGDEVTCHFNITCNENKGKRYNRISAWRLYKTWSAMSKVEVDENLPF